MTLLAPLGLLGLLGIVALIVIYILRPNYQQKFISTTFVWKLSLKYKKKRIPISKLRNFLIILCQILILTSCAFILAQPNKVLKMQVKESEVVLIIDASASMRTEQNNKTRFERAVDQAIDMAEETFANGGYVSVVVAGSKVEVLQPQRAFGTNSEELLDQMEALTSEDTFACSYGVADLEGAIEACEEIYIENPNAQMVLFTDEKYEHPLDGITVKYVGDSNEWNAAILNAYTEIYRNSYSFIVELATYGASAPVNVELSVQGANASITAPEGTPYTFEYVVDCSMDETTSVIFINEENYWENPTRYDNVYDFVCWADVEKISTYKTIHVEINENDNFAADDTFDLYDGAKEVIKVQYASSKPNVFFTTVLSRLQKAYADRWDFQITEVKAGEEGLIEGFDFYIFEHTMPATLPVDGVVFLINPNEAPRNAGFTVKKEGNSNKQDLPLTVTEGNEEHPILKNTDGSNVTITAWKEIQNLSGDYTMLWERDGMPMLAIKDNPSEKVVLLNFSLHFSNLPLLIEYPMFIYNMFQYFFPATVSANAYEVNDTLKLNARGDELVVSKGEKETTFTEFPASYTLETPGQYTLTQTTWANKTITEFIFVKVPAAESYITKSGENLKNPYQAPDQKEYFEDWMIYLAAALTALLFIEWWLSSRNTM